MIKKGIIITTFILGGLILGGSVALPVSYFINEQYQNVASSQNDDVLVKDEEVYLSTEENPLFPGESRELNVSVSKTIPATCDVRVYFDSFSGEGYEYLSLSIKKDNEEKASVSSIVDANENNVINIETHIDKDSSFQFCYTLSKDLPSTYEDLSFSFTMHMRVDR